MSGELASHPFFLATLFQPQVGAVAGRPLHPLIGALLDAARERRAAPAALRSPARSIAMRPQSRARDARSRSEGAPR
jgi:hypothetical protein